MSPALRLILLSLALTLGACSPDEPPASQTESPPAAEVRTTAELAQRLVDALGGRMALESVQTLVGRGAGTRTRLGQIAATGGEDPMGSLAGVTETIDLANGRAAFDYDVAVDAFMQHRTEALTIFNGTPVGWATGPGRPNIVTTPNGLFSWATQNSPAMLLRRNVITVALAAADTAAASQAAEERAFNGSVSLYGTAELPPGESVELYFDPATGLLDGFVTLDTETMLGDVEAEYVLDDYRPIAGPIAGPVAGLVLPHSVTIRKQGRAYSSIVYDSITVNDPAALAIFDVPADAVAMAEQAVAADGAFAPLLWNDVAPGIYHALGYSHHSMVVEFPTFVAVVEGPYTEAQSLTLARIVDERLGKPIRYVVPTHPHYDHTGGLRGLAAVGATVLVAAGHEAELRAIVEAPQTNPPDELARATSAGGEVGAVEVFSEMTVIEEGDRRLEVYEVATIPHVNPKVLAFVPGEGVLFQSDLFFGGPGPDTTALYEAVRERDLDVQLIVGGHGGTLPFSTLASAAAAE